MNVASPLHLAIAAVQYWTFGELHDAFHRLPARLRRHSTVDKFHAWLVENGNHSRREALAQADIAVESLRHQDDEEIDQATQERLMQQHVLDHARTLPRVDYLN